jgi:tRNA nucleotidyltransferase (CCA-adding enzyme)
MSGAGQSSPALIGALRALPGGEALLAAADSRTHLVGGAVRDLLLGERPRELDVVVEGDATALATALGASTVNERFRTAIAIVDGARVDIAEARRERYPAPAALPEVEPAPLGEDLLRRDFTVNAIALSLRDGELQAVPKAFADLESRLLRVLHDDSFRDDPTRLVRLARYAERLSFEVEPRTARLAAAASLAQLGDARLGDELRLTLTEPDPLAVLGRLPLGLDAPLAERGLELLPADGDRGLLMLGCCADLAARLDGLEFTARERDIVARCFEAPAIARKIAAAERPSQLHAELRREPVEAVALAGAHGPADAVERWLRELRHVQLQIGGDDLIAAGLEPGPELGRRLERTLARKLDGELAAGREAELRSALAE